MKKSFSLLLAVLLAVGLLTGCGSGTSVDEYEAVDVNITAIAGPTGEGITDARSFCRHRRCVLAEGGLRII